MPQLVWGIFMEHQGGENPGPQSGGFGEATALAEACFEKAGAEKGEARCPSGSSKHKCYEELLVRSSFIFRYTAAMEKDKNTAGNLGVNFAKLWTANAISTIGDGALLAAGPLLVASKTHQPILVAGAAFVQQLPWLLFTLISGVYVDRFDRRKLLIIANLFRAFAVGLSAVAIITDFAVIPITYLGLFLLGTGDTFADNSAVAFLPKLVPKDLLSRANSRLQAVNIIGRQLAGPPLGAYLFVVAAAVPFGFDAVTFIIAACLISWISTVSLAREKSDKVVERSVRKEIQEGLSWLWSTPLLRTIAVSNGVLQVTFMAAFAPFVLFVHERLGLGSMGYGLLLSLAAAGGVMGTFAIKPLQHRFNNISLLRVTLIAEAVVDLSFAFVRSPLLAGVLIFTLWFEAVIWNVIATSLRQQEAPPNLLGRVNSVFNLFRMGGLSIGALAGGVIAQVFGVAAPFLLAGVMVFLLAIFLWGSFKPVTSF